MGKILIGADFVPTQSNEQLFVSGNLMELFGEQLFSVLNDAEYKMFNLEMPLTNTLNPLEKCGPALIGKPESVTAYREMNVDLLTLANNHIMDQSVGGLDDTIQILTRNGIHCVGASTNLSQSQKPFVFQCKNGKRVGVYACAEHEFSIAEENKPGANPFDAYESFDHVHHLAEGCDYVIVLYHGGKEFYRYPSPLLQKTCRKFIEKGADLVVTQHSHCVGCQEEYHDGLIVYGQGNFLFDGGDDEFWRSGLLIGIDTETLSLELIPLIKNGATVRLADHVQRKEILESFIRRSEEIKDADFLMKNYRAFAREKAESYLLNLYGIGARNLIFRVLNKLSGYRYQGLILRRRYGKKQCLAIENYISCEAHSELMIEGIRQFRNNLRRRRTPCIKSHM